jgi:hypothetical protein
MSLTAKYLAIEQKCVNCGMTKKIYYESCQKSKSLNHFVDLGHQGFPLCFSSMFTWICGLAECWSGDCGVLILRKIEFAEYHIKGELIKYCNLHKYCIWCMTINVIGMESRYGAVFSSFLCANRQVETNGEKKFLITTIRSKNYWDNRINAPLTPNSMMCEWLKRENSTHFF